VTSHPAELRDHTANDDRGGQLRDRGARVTVAQVWSRNIREPGQLGQQTYHALPRYPQKLQVPR
jgi:hypothetical protein